MTARWKALSQDHFRGSNWEQVPQLCQSQLLLCNKGFLGPAIVLFRNIGGVEGTMHVQRIVHSKMQQCQEEGEDIKQE